MLRLAVSLHDADSESVNGEDVTYIDADAQEEGEEPSDAGSDEEPIDEPLR